MRLHRTARWLRWMAGALLVCTTASSATADSGENLLADGDFERHDLQLGHREQPRTWTLYGDQGTDARVAIAQTEGRSGGHCLRYDRATDSRANVHVDQILPVQTNTIYEVSAWMRSAGELKPLLAVATLKWKLLSVTASDAGGAWRQVRLAFDSAEHAQVRLEWFPGARGKPYAAHAGTSWLDDVTVRVMPHPPQSVTQALRLLRPHPEAALDPRTARPGAIGNPLPLRGIHCRAGALVYEDGGEVALWGANFQSALSWEYQGRLRPAGVPLEAPALHKVTNENLDQLERLGTRVVRAHLLPSDFTDADGNLIETVYLDALDHLLAECGRRGIYVYLTLLNDMRVYHCQDSFMVGRQRRDWLFDPRFLECMERYVRAILDHENRYTHRLYRADPTIALLEPINEPEYPDYLAVSTEDSLRPTRAAFQAWCAERGVQDLPELGFRTFRYERVRAVVDRLAATIRATGTRKPVVWNLNWPRMVVTHEDVYQAVAESTVDGVSFCLYPGQADVPSPFWEHPTDLSGRNYLPFLADCYRDYDQLRWLLGKRFAQKAKVAYEFETFYNQSSYLYPAMARLMRALGAQIAPLWQYTLAPAATYCGGSHYMNLDCTPSKAVSFRIAAGVFSRLPRYTPYESKDATEMTFNGCAVSFPRNVSILQTDDLLCYSRSTPWAPLAINSRVQNIVGCGASPLLAYEGSGAYFVQIGEQSIDVTIRPDVSYPRPPWQPPGRRPWLPTCTLDSQTPHRLELRLPGWQSPISIHRMEGQRRWPVPQLPGLTAFMATPGCYRIEHAPGDALRHATGSH